MQTPKRDRNEEHAAPKRDLHHAENPDRDNIREGVARKLVSRIDRELPELGKYLPSKRDCAQYLDSKQEQIRARFLLFVVCFHWSMISVSHPKHPPVPAYLDFPNHQNFASFDSSIMTVSLHGEFRWLNAPNSGPYLMNVTGKLHKEFEAFERLENEFNARERKERAAKLGLGSLKETFTQTH